MANKHIKRFSTSLVIRKMKINYNEIPPHTHSYSNYFFKKEKNMERRKEGRKEGRRERWRQEISGEDVEKLEALSTAGENMK